MKNGFTLIELITSVVLVGIIATTTYSVLEMGLRIWRKSDLQSETRQEVRVVFQQLTREVKTARSLSIVTPQHITFQIDENNDGLDETMDYQLNGTNFEKIRATVTHTLLNDVTSLIFSGGAGTPLTIDLTTTGPEGDVLNFHTGILVRDALP